MRQVVEKAQTGQPPATWFICDAESVYILHSFLIANAVPVTSLRIYYGIFIQDKSVYFLFK